MPSKPSPLNSCRSGGCTLTGALSVTTSVVDSATIIHGPAGCAHHNFSLLHATGLDNDRITSLNLFSSGMLEPEVIFGGEDALERAIRRAVRGDYSVVYVLSACIADTIGDDVPAVCRKDWGVPVIPVPTAGFLGGSFQDGVNNALVSIAGTLTGTAERKNGICANIIGEKNLEFEVEENFNEVSRLLSLLGITINVRFIHCAGTGELASLGGATLNVLRDEGMGSLGDLLNRKYGTRAVPAFPAGLSGTLRFLQSAGEIAGTDAGDRIAGETGAQASLLEDFSDIAGSSIRFDPVFPGLTDDRSVSEVIERLGLEVSLEGVRVPAPLSPPVGTAGVRRLLHRWRRALHA